MCWFEVDYDFVPEQITDGLTFPFKFVPRNFHSGNLKFEPFTVHHNRFDHVRYLANRHYSIKANQVWAGVEKVVLAKPHG